MNLDDAPEAPDTSPDLFPARPEPDLSSLLIGLLKGVLYREQDERQWSTLQNLQARVRDYVGVLGLELVMDEAEGYAYLKGRPDTDPGDDASGSTRLPRLISRRPLSFPVSLLLALLRKKMIESDASGDDVRLILSRDDIVELLRVFLPDSANEVRLVNQIDASIAKVVDLGFLRPLRNTRRTAGHEESYEVRRILKAFVDAQWLGTFAERLEDYRRHLTDMPSNMKQDNDHE